jgi:hypothetical protein
VAVESEEGMSTHSVLGIRYPDGSISGCYVHYDGLTMLPRIEDYIERFTTTGLAILITKAQHRGGMRSFNQRIYGGSQHNDGAVGVTDFLDDGVPYHITEDSFHKDHMGTSAWYLVDYEKGTVDSTERDSDNRANSSKHVISHHELIGHATELLNLV